MTNYSLSVGGKVLRPGGGGGHHRLLAALFSCKAILIGSMLKSRVQGAPCPGVLPSIHRLRNFYKTRQQDNHGWRNRGDREGPSPPGPINSISWEGPGGPNIYQNGPFLLLFQFFSNCSSCVGGFGTFEILGDPFPRGPPRPRPPPPHLSNHFSSPD